MIPDVTTKIHCACPNLNKYRKNVYYVRMGLSGKIKQRHSFVNKKRAYKIFLLTIVLAVDILALH